MKESTIARALKQAQPHKLKAALESALKDRDPHKRLARKAANGVGSAKVLVWMREHDSDHEIAHVSTALDMEYQETRQILAYLVRRGEVIRTREGGKGQGNRSLFRAVRP